MQRFVVCLQEVQSLQMKFDLMCISARPRVCDDNIYRKCSAVNRSLYEEVDGYGGDDDDDDHDDIKCT